MNSVNDLSPAIAGHQNQFTGPTEAPAETESLGDLSKADLVKRAQELKIKGRSAMDTEELIEAIGQAQTAG